MKPVYRIPTMTEVNNVPANGFNAASTFSGGGGSSLGYRMAGYKVLYANEFVESARDTYTANKHDYTYLDDRDIRKVSPEDILDKMNLAKGELDLLDGSPPCASFSTAGSRQSHWGKSKAYSDTSQRCDDLFFEFSRILEGIQPKTFVAENVSGLVKGTAKGYFIEIIRDLRSKGYRVDARLLDASKLGVPQRRVRLIFVGVREDIEIDPVHPTPFPYSYSMKEALDFKRKYPIEPEACMKKYAVYQKLIGLKQGGQAGFCTKPRWHQPCPTVMASGCTHGNSGTFHPLENRLMSIEELKRLCSYPDDFKLVGDFSQQWERLGRSVPPLMMREIARTIAENILSKVPVHA